MREGEGAAAPYLPRDDGGGTRGRGGGGASQRGFASSHVAVWFSRLLAAAAAAGFPLRQATEASRLQAPPNPIPSLADKRARARPEIIINGLHFAVFSYFVDSAGPKA